MIIRILGRSAAAGFLLVAGLLLTVTGVAPAQSPPSPASSAGEVDPIRCWWKTTASAVRVGETFSVVLTCAVIESAVIKVVPDQSALDPKTIQLPPFEVLGGVHVGDLEANDHRFTQYEYKIRILNDQLFGKDVKLPEIRIAYRVQRLADRASSVEGRENLYLLPPLSVRVLSIVPNDAPDIRNVPAATFAEIETRTFHATTLVFAGVVFFVLAAVALIIWAVRFFGKYGAKEIGAPRLVSNLAILRTVEAEFAEIQRKRETSGWTPGLAGRALAGFRIASCFVMSKRINQSASGPSVSAEGGTLLVSGRGLSGTQAIVSGSVTAQNIALEMERLSSNGKGSMDQPERLRELHQALIQFTQAQYGRNGSPEVRNLDRLLAAGLQMVRQLEIENKWLKKKIALVNEKTLELRSRVWER